MTIDTGTLAVLRPYEELRSAGASFRELVLSDHVALFTYIDMDPMPSLRLPRIDKVKMVEKVNKMFKYEINEFRKNFYKNYINLRHQFTCNTA